MNKTLGIGLIPNNDCLTNSIPIWYEYQNGMRININDTTIIIKDSAKRFDYLRFLSRRKIQEWQNMKLLNLNAQSPYIIFYEKNGD